MLSASFSIPKCLLSVVVLISVILTTPAQSIPLVRRAPQGNSQDNQGNTTLDLLNLVNDLRKSKGVPPLCLSNSLVNAAEVHSNEMAQNTYMDHNGKDGSTPWARIQNAGFKGGAMGENVAYAFQDSVSVIFKIWSDSPPHFANMINPIYNQIGIARATAACPTEQAGVCTYWTETFGNGNDGTCSSS